MHVDKFVDDYGNKEYYARWFLFLKRLPAIMRAEFEDYIKQFELFCDYQGETYRVTGASRMGDIWLAKDFKREVGYDLRVDLDECSNFRAAPGAQRKEQG